MPGYADVDGKARLKRTSSRRLAIFVEIIISFKIKYACKTSFGCFVYEQYLMGIGNRIISIKSLFMLTDVVRLTCTLWHCIKLCIWVNILKTMCSIVLCSSNIIRAKSKST